MKHETIEIGTVGSYCRFFKHGPIRYLQTPLEVYFVKGKLFWARGEDTKRDYVFKKHNTKIYRVELNLKTGLYCKVKDSGFWSFNNEEVCEHQTIALGD